MIKNILWNVDGTLFDTYPAVTYAYSKTLNEMGFSIPLNVIDGLVRTSFNDLVEMLYQRFKLDPQILRAKFKESYRAVSPTNQPPFPGVREVCEFIHQNSGINIAITHRSPEITQELFNAHNFAELIDDIFSAKQARLENPDPYMALAVLEKHGLNPDETLFVGDRECDIRAASTAGVRTCLFGHAHMVEAADYKLNDYHRLLEILQRM